MNSEQQSALVGGTSVAVCSVLAGLQPDEVMKYINLGLAILSAAFSLAFIIWKWYREAKKDGKITIEEVGDLVDRVTDEAAKQKETIEGTLSKDKKEKEEKENENS